MLLYGEISGYPYWIVVPVNMLQPRLGGKGPRLLVPSQKDIALSVTVLVLGLCHLTGKYYFTSTYSYKVADVLCSVMSQNQFFENSTYFVRRIDVYFSKLLNPLINFEKMSVCLSIYGGVRFSPILRILDFSVLTT